MKDLLQNIKELHLSKAEFSFISKGMYAVGHVKEVYDTCCRVKINPRLTGLRYGIDIPWVVYYDSMIIC